MVIEGKDLHGLQLKETKWFPRFTSGDVASLK